MHGKVADCAAVSLYIFTTNNNGKVANCPAVSLYIYTTNNGKVAELEVKARQLEIELDLTIEKFGTVGKFCLLATL